jgi:hypothetical protein
MVSHEKLDYLDSGIEYQFIEGSPHQVMFKHHDISGIVSYNEFNDTFTLKGKLHQAQAIKYWAANPMIRNYSYSGSGLPYPNPEVAYHNTPNSGLINPEDNDQDQEFIITLKHPSEYYVKLGKKLLKPHVHLLLVDQNKIITVVIGDAIPNRSLTNFPGFPNRSTGR